MNYINLLDQIEKGTKLEVQDFTNLLKNRETAKGEVFSRAQIQRKKYFGDKVYIRGLIEFSNYCRNDCYYCGIRASNSQVKRYRLQDKDLSQVIDRGLQAGLSTFVLQSGEDPYFTDERLVSWIEIIKSKAPKVAITLSIGERSYESYKLLREAGADRFLLRHETINPLHYKKLHPPTMAIETRIESLYHLKELGYQVGAGFMVGSPFQSLEDIGKDLYFLQELKPEMIGVGPFLSHRETPFAGEKNGDLDLSLYIIALLRILIPRANIPATTALQTLSEKGRIEGLKAGANVLMPNLSPPWSREKYCLYDNKASFALEAMENIEELKLTMKNNGFIIDMGRGDYLKEE